MTVSIIIFAKAPHPGDVKTRLVPVLGEAGAAALHERLVKRTLDTAIAAGAGAVELCCAPGATHSFFVSCAASHRVSLAEQGPGDLGERMHRAAVRALTAHRGVLIIGCDCPALTPAYLQAAAAALDEGYDAALGPAEDGGYVLIALARSDAALFEDVRWGSAEVMAATAARLAALGWRWRRLEPLWDVDRPADLARVRRELTDGEELVSGIWPRNID